MIQKIMIIVLVSFGWICAANAENYSMRKCMTLPVADSLGNTLGFKIYEGVESYLKDRGWCEYVSSSEVIEIFSKYREKLKEHISDPNVIKTVADRLQVGSIFRISLDYDVDSVEVQLDVVGENGTDIYLSEKAVLQKIEFNQIITTITNWLDLYEGLIPYDGRVLGVLGDQLTLSFPKNKAISVSQEFSVKRLIKTKKHPLLKKIVEWESRPLAKGKIYNASRNQALGLIKIYISDRKAQIGDWIKLEKEAIKPLSNRKKLSDYEDDSYGKLGELTLALNMSSHTTTTSVDSDNLRFGGLVYGVTAEAEAWITREYFIFGEFTRKVGNLENSAGEADTGRTAQSLGILKIGGGYKYLPMGFFYGPQVNLYGGWAKYSYELDKTEDEGLGTNSISGLMLGVGGSIPLQKEIRIFGNAEMMPFPEFNDESNIFGSVKSISSIVFELGAHYQYTTLIKILGSIEVVSNSAKFKGSTEELGYRDTSFKIGGVFTF